MCCVALYYELKHSFWEEQQQLIKLNGVTGSSPRLYKHLLGERGLSSGAAWELCIELHSCWGVLKSPSYSFREPLSHATVSDKKLFCLSN